jgi:hypothetical protein
MLYVPPVTLRIVKLGWYIWLAWWLGCVKHGMPQEYRWEDLLEDSHMNVVVG